MSGLGAIGAFFGYGKTPPAPKAQSVAPAPDPAAQVAAAEAALTARKQKPQIAGTPSGSKAMDLAGATPAPALTASKTLLGL